MAKNYFIQLPGHNNVYNGNSDRYLKIYYSIPDNGVNENTGLLLLSAGFGASATSNVYVKMRSTFADQYNLVTIQCDYFGCIYMQMKNEIILDKYFKSEYFKAENIKSRNIQINVKDINKETIDDFADMSWMQAIDLMTAVHHIETKLINDNMSYNKNRLIGYGHSQGAFLLHLCNRLNPNFFTYIIDNSAWVAPHYIKHKRALLLSFRQFIIELRFDYIGRDIMDNIDDIHLNTLYTGFDNQSSIIIFQGDDDNLIDHNEKMKIFSNVSKCKFIMVREQDIDNERFKSNHHGLDADFLKLFDYAIEFEPKEGAVRKQEDAVVEIGKKMKASVSYNDLMPEYQFENIKK